MGRRAELMYVTMSLNLEIRQQRSCIQFTLHTVTLNSAFSPDQSVDICSETSAQLLHGCSATVLYRRRPTYTSSAIQIVTPFGL